MKLGVIAAFMVFGLVLIYSFILILGFLSLKSPDDPIGDPYFFFLEPLIIVIALLMVISFVAVHINAPVNRKIQSLTALSLMIIMACITSIVHFTIMTFGRAISSGELKQFSWLLSFKWPSIVYSLDILAWDFFFPFSMFFAAAVFKGDRLRRIVSILFIVSGLLSLIGLLGIPFNNMLIRNIGIIGYAVVAPASFLVLGLILRKL